MKQIIKQLWLCAILLSATLPSWAYDFEVDGIYYGKNSDGNTVSVTYKDTNYNSYSGSVVIPSTVTYSGTTYSVTSIGYTAFDHCSGLTSVTIPNSVTSIGSSAFNRCSGLTSVTIPNSVTSIGSNAFAYCSSLTKVEISDIAVWCKISFKDSLSNPLYYAKHLYLNGTEVTNLVIPNSVTKIDAYAFRNCSGLTSVTIPNSVTEIGREAFTYCSGLTSVTISNSVTSIGESAFYGCSGLASVIFNAENCKTMGSSSFPAFYCCTKLTSVVIGENVKTIPNNAFFGCDALTDLTIGSSVNSIGASAFDIARLGRINVLNSVPPTCYDNTVFKSVDKENCLLTIPHGTIDLYSTTYVWWDFKRMKEDEGQGDIETINSDAINVTTEGGAIHIDGAAGAVAEVYSLSGALLYRGTDETIALPRGVYIVKVAGTTTKVML